MSLKTREFDPARYLDSDEATDEYILAASESGDPHELAAALGVVARARGITDIARKSGLSRQAIYKALDADGNPEFGTIAKVADALGFKLSLVPKARRGQRTDAPKTRGLRG
nr:addiction module antidote protein [uncultured Shinella sp.]